MVEPEISIVTRNRPKILEEALDRAESAGLIRHIRIIDGSEGGETKNICGNYSVCYQSQESTGMTAARNEALEHCESDYIVFIDDDVRVSENWYEAISETFEEKDVVGVTGKLEGEEAPLEGVAGKIRNLVFGGKDRFGEILDSGVINGDFFYEKRKEVDHMPGCNMAFDVQTLKETGGFDEKVDVGNSYREDTIASYKVGKEGKIVYNPEASLEHLAINEQGDQKRWHFYNPYLTKYFLNEYDVLGGIEPRIRYLFNMLIRHIYFLKQSLTSRNRNYLYYLLGELASFRDFIVLNRDPREYL